MSPEPHKSVEVFYSYAQEDEELRDELKKHLSNLKRQGVITDWYDRDISAGKEWNDGIKQHLGSARVILLLISPDFMNSDYINDIEVKRAMERHESGEARVIPVILRPVDWEGARFSKLQALPKDALPVTSWKDPDEALLDITKGIRKAVQELSGPSAGVPTVPDIPRPPRVGFVSRRDRDGRDILGRLQSELVPKKNQLVALWGAGGVGKTILAAEAARALAEADGQRIIWITAEGRPNFAFSTLLDDIAEQLGCSDLRPLAVGPKESELRKPIGAKPTLIVLDNLETIAPAEESLCKDFLSRRTPCPALITTRERIEDAVLIPLATMSPQEASEFLDRLIAQTHDPQIYAAIDPNRILRISEYNPLIIQWIVAQIDLAHDPEQVLKDLWLGEGDAAQRVFDRSFNLPQMADGGRAVLLALSLFMPGGTRTATAEVARMGSGRENQQFEHAQETLASLWLARQTDGGRRLVIEGLTREVAKERLSREENAVEFRRRFVDYFLRYTKEHDGSEGEDFDALEAEKDNILNAVDVGFDLDDWESVKNLMLIIGRTPDGFLNLRGYWHELFDYERRAEMAARRINDEWAMAKFSVNAAEVSRRLGKYKEVRQVYEQARTVFKSLGAKREIASTVHRLGVIAQDQGDTDEALRHYKDSLEINTGIENQGGIAANKHQMGMLAHEQGDLSEAEDLYRQSMEIQEEIGNQWGVANNLHNLGRIEQTRGNIPRAEQFYADSLRIKQELGDQGGIAITLHQLALMAQDRGDLEEALRLQNIGSEIEKILDHQRGIAIALHQLGRLSQDQGKLVEARTLYIESLEIKTKIRDQGGIASTLIELGRLEQNEDHPVEARELYEKSLVIAKECGYKKSMAVACHQLGRLALANKDFARAENYFNESLTLLMKMEDKQGASMCLESIGNLRRAQRRFREAEANFSEALEIAEALGSKYRIGKIKCSSGLLAEEENDWKQAAQLLCDSLCILEEVGSPQAEAVRQDLERVNANLD